MSKPLTLATYMAELGVRIPAKPPRSTNKPAVTGGKK